MQLVMLKELLKKDLVTQLEFDLIKNKLKKKHKIIEPFLVI
jgi:hypothetical protein